jgi:transposase
MIAAISSKGRVFFAVNQGKTTALTFGLFIVGLCQVLDEKDQNWRKEVTFLLDNAPYHRAVASFALYECLGIPTMFLAPYSFKMAAVEKLFSYVKNRDLNPLVARSYTR